MTKTTVLITGANRGLGLEMAKLYAARPDTHVIACCRNPDAATALNIDGAAITREAMDMVDHAAIDGLAAKLSGTPIDIAIHNAGIFGKNPAATTGFQDQQFGNSNFEDDWIMPYRVNVIGGMKLAEAFADHIAASDQKKLAIITSVIGSVAGAMGHMFGYAASKAAANMTTRNLSIALRDRGIIVNPIHPGYARTDMSGPGADIDPIDGARGVIERIDEMAMETSGDFLSYDGRSIPW
ncbi:MAG: SDR family oxidoreductase [Pseudomonadota bacterium]